jgi:GNAT acetyltransferase
VHALFTHDERGRLQRVNEPDGAEAPRFFLGRTIAGHIWRFRYDLPDLLAERLESLCLKEPVTDLRQEPAGLSEYSSLLETHSPVKKLSSGPAYFFPDRIEQRSRRAIPVTPDNIDVLHQGLEEWIPDVPHRQPFLAILNEGHAVSVCCSVRITAEAHEVGVETLNDYRGRGYASDVVQQWATEVRKLEVMPLYSTSWENVASQGVARRLGLVQYGSDFHIT